VLLQALGLSVLQDQECAGAGMWLVTIAADLCNAEYGDAPAIQLGNQFARQVREGDYA
jgi:hypothetical protein